METPVNVEVDPYADNHVPVTEGDEQFAEAVGELPQDDGSTKQNGNGTPLEAEGERDGLPPLATGNGRVAATSGPPMGSMQELADTILCAAQFVQDPVPPIPVVARPAQPLSVSGAYAHAPPIGAMPGVRSWLPDPSELYALPRMPYPSVGYLPAPAGRMTPAPITATARAAVTTTVTSSIAMSAAQTGLAYASPVGPHTPFPGANVVRPGYGWRIIPIISVRRSKILVESGCTAIPAPDTPKSELLEEFQAKLLGTWDPAGTPCRVASVEELVRCRTMSRPPEEAVELDQERLEPLGT